MRTGHQRSNTTLTTIITPANGYSVPFLKDSSRLGQASAYIRPLQCDLDKLPVVKVTFILPILVLFHLSNDSLFTLLYIHDPIISDHFAIHCKLNSDRPPNPKKTVSYRKLRSVNTDTFRQDILSSELLSTNSSDLNSLCSRYDDVISAIVDKHAPLVTKTITVRPWYTDDIGVEKSTRRRFERR